MKNLLVLSALSIMLAFSACKKDKVAAIDLPEGFFENDWNATKQSAKENDRKIFIHFYKPNCDKCAAFKKDILNDAEVEDYIKNNLIGASLNTKESDGKTVSEEYDIIGHPGMAIADKEGNLLVKRLGVIQKDAFMQWLRDNK